MLGLSPSLHAALELQQSRHLTNRSSRDRFAASLVALSCSTPLGRCASRLNSGVRPHITHSDDMNISTREYHARRRRIIILSIFAVMLGVGNSLWGCYQSSKGIQPVDYVGAAVVAVLIAGCCYAGWRLALRRVSSERASAPQQTGASESATPNDGEA
jgi:hypothetical protein